MYVIQAAHGDFITNEDVLGPNNSFSSFSVPFVFSFFFSMADENELTRIIVLHLAGWAVSFKRFESQVSVRIRLVDRPENWDKSWLFLQIVAVN